MYRTDRPLGMNLAAITFFAIGFWLLLNTIFAVPLGICLILFVPGMLANGLWTALLGGSQLLFGLGIWTGHRFMRRLTVSGPGVIMGLNALSALTGNAWSVWSIILSTVVLLYFQSQEAKRYFQI